MADFESICPDACFADLVALVNHLIVPISWARRCTNRSNPGEAAEALWNCRRQAVVVTCGADGCSVRRRRGFASGARHQPAYRVEAIDTTGCGDVFHGAYAAALVRGLDIPTAIRFASVAAGLKAASPGGQAGIPTLAAVEGRMAAFPDHARHGVVRASET